MRSPSKTPRLSGLESKLLALLPSDGSRVTTFELVDLYYGDDLPFSANAIITGRMRTIIAKIAAGCPGPKIEHSRKRGPIAKEYWIVPDEVQAI